MVLDQRAYILFYVRRHPRAGVAAAAATRAAAAAAKAAAAEANAAAEKGQAEQEAVAGRPVKRARQEQRQEGEPKSALALMLDNLKEGKSGKGTGGPGELGQVAVPKLKQQQQNGKAHGAASGPGVADGSGKAGAKAAAPEAVAGAGAEANGVANGHGERSGVKVNGNGKRRLEQQQESQQEAGVGAGRQGAQQQAGPEGRGAAANGRCGCGVVHAFAMVRNVCAFDSAGMLPALRWPVHRTIAWNGTIKRSGRTHWSHHD